MDSPYLAASTSPECPWNALEMHHLTLLGGFLITFGIIGAAANGMLCAGCLLGIGIPGSRIDQGHRLLLLNLSVASLGALLLAGFPFTGPSSIHGRWIFGNACCQLFGSLRQMFGFAQVSAIFLLAFERYWLFYVITKEQSRMMTIKGLAWAIVSCWMLSIAWAIPPLIHWGRYACDSTRTTCELDWHMTNSSQVTYNLAYLIFGFLIPTGLIFFCLWRAYKVIKLLSIDTGDFGVDSQGQYFITKVVAFLALGIYLAWLPRGITVFWTMVIGNEDGKSLPTALKIISPIFIEASTTIPLIVYFTLGRDLRRTILGMFKRNTKQKHGMIRLQMK
uniref:RGR-like protein n=1 Tax=Indolestes peregrinus TaxID=546916 RepID=A0A0C6FZG7_9ODON|nr:opsin, RGR-like [Indolestes peregrinus]